MWSQNWGVSGGVKILLLRSPYKPPPRNAKLKNNVFLQNTSLWYNLLKITISDQLLGIFVPANISTGALPLTPLGNFRQPYPLTNPLHNPRSAAEPSALVRRRVIKICNQITDKKKHRYIMALLTLHRIHVHQPSSVVVAGRKLLLTDTSSASFATHLTAVNEGSTRLFSGGHVSCTGRWFESLGCEACNAERETVSGACNN